MSDRVSENFDGFITPEGELVSIDDADRMYKILAKRTEDAGKLAEMLRGFARECFERGRFDGGCAYLEKALPLVESAPEKADCLLMIGQGREQSGDLKAARRAYQRAFRLPQEKDDVWYFLNNNLAYCLNAEGKHKKAEMHCRAAIRINSKRHNAYKNLGIALEGQGRYVDAARSYIRATRLCSQDTRAAALLERLIDAHAEDVDWVPKLRAQLNELRQWLDSSPGSSQIH